MLSGEDILKKTDFKDATLLTTWPIDLHYPLERYENPIPGKPFIAREVQGKGLDNCVGCQIPYRILFSRNVPNLFMVGRNISVNRDAIGSIRVMKKIS